MEGSILTDNREPAYIYEGVDTVPSEDVHSIPLSEGVLNAINATKRAVNASIYAACCCR